MVEIKRRNIKLSRDVILLEKSEALGGSTAWSKACCAG